MAYSYEAKQGPQHIQLAQELMDTSFYLNSTVTTLRHEVSALASSIKIYLITKANTNSGGGLIVVVFFATFVVTKLSGTKMTILMFLTILFQLLSRKFPLPEGQTVLTEGQLNQYTREYLQILVTKKLLVRFIVA